MDHKNTIASTDQVVSTRYKPHGKVIYGAEVSILQTTAIGPFNVELISALENLALARFPRISQLGPWAQCVFFRESSLASREVLKVFELLLRRLVDLKIAPTYTAFVFSSDVEGAKLMGSLWAECYKFAGLKFEIFDKSEHALEWINSFESEF